MKHIRTARELADFADEHRLRLDWHEPDEQDITARFAEGYGGFDNAMGTDTIGANFSGEHIPVGTFGKQWEHCVIFSDKHVDLAVVNLASLCAWATKAHRAGVTTP